MNVFIRFGGDDFGIDVDEECQSLDELRDAIEGAHPQLCHVDMENVVLFFDGAPMTDDCIAGLSDGSLIEVAPTKRALTRQVLKDDVHCRAVYREAVSVFDLDTVRTYVEACEYFLDRPDFYGSPETITMATPTHYAVTQQHLPLLQLLLECGASTTSGAPRTDSFSRSSGPTPVHFAAGAEDTECLKVLLAAGAAADTPDVFTEEPPLFAAAREGRVEQAKLLLAAGADVLKCKSLQQRTPLHAAAAAGQPGMVEFLLDKGVSPSEKDREQATPLHAAVRGCRGSEVGVDVDVAAYREVVKLLLDAGASRTHRDLNNFMPEQWGRGGVNLFDEA